MGIYLFLFNLFVQDLFVFRYLYMSAYILTLTQKVFICSDDKIYGYFLLNSVNRHCLMKIAVNFLLHK